MGFINEDGLNVSYDASELIEDLKRDIAEFGGNTIVAVWCKKAKGVEIYTNYDFIDKDDPISKTEIEDDEYLKQMSMTALLMLLEMENEIL
jgi:hypothetical protein